MATKNEQQLNEIQKKNLEAAMRLAQLSIENSQRIMELQVGTAKSLFEEGAANAKALSSVKDPAEAMNLRTAYAQSWCSGRTSGPQERDPSPCCAAYR